MKKILFFISIFWLISSPLQANNIFSFNDAFMILMPTKSGGIFGELVNHSNKDMRIIGAQSPHAKKIELHTHKKEGNVMKMVQIDDIIVPANSSKKLKQGGIHIMVMGVDKTLSFDDMIEINILLDNGHRFTQNIILKPLRYLKGKSSHHDYGHKHDE